MQPVWRIDPPVSDPNVIGTLVQQPLMAADPPEEPPGTLANPQDYVYLKSRIFLSLPPISKFHPYLVFATEIIPESVDFPITVAS